MFCCGDRVAGYIYGLTRLLRVYLKASEYLGHRVRSWRDKSGEAKDKAGHRPRLRHATWLLVYFCDSNAMANACCVHQSYRSRRWKGFPTPCHFKRRRASPGAAPLFNSCSVFTVVSSFQGHKEQCHRKLICGAIHGAERKIRHHVCDILWHILCLPISSELPVVNTLALS